MAIFFGKKALGSLAIAFGLLPAIVGCGMFKTSDNGRKVDQVNPQLAAEWDSNCSKIGFLGFASKSSVVTFSAAGDFDRSTSIYSADGCGTGDHAVDLKVSGTYDIVGDANVSDMAGHNINFTVAAATLTPASAHAVELLNAASYCGVSDWKANTAVDVAGKECAGESLSQGAVIFDVYAQDGDKRLFFGNGSAWFDRTSSGDRPAALDKDITFQRQ